MKKRVEKSSLKQNLILKAIFLFLICLYFIAGIFSHGAAYPTISIIVLGIFLIIFGVHLFAKKFQHVSLKIIFNLLLIFGVWIVAQGYENMFFNTGITTIIFVVLFFGCSYILSYTERRDLLYTRIGSIFPIYFLMSMSFRYYSPMKIFGLFIPYLGNVIFSIFFLLVLIAPSVFWIMQLVKNRKEGNTVSRYTVFLIVVSILILLYALFDLMLSIAFAH